MAEKFVLSAHGSATFKQNFMFTIPENVNIITYGPLDTGIAFTNADPNRICSNTYGPAYQRFVGNQLFPNFLLWSDHNGIFHSGVKRCIDNSVVLNIDALPDIINTINGYRHKIDLEKVVNYIKGNMPSYFPIEIHLCICLGQINEMDLLTMAMQSSTLNSNYVPPDIQQITQGMQSMRLGGKYRKLSKQYKKSQKKRSKINKQKQKLLKY
jgi:hypothetical protein